MQNHLKKTLILTGVVILGAGSATAQDYQPRMGEPLPGLSPTQLQVFEQGKIAYTRQLTAPEGLGPGFNDDSCAACHGTPAAGGFGTKTVFHFGSWSGGVFDPLANKGGDVLQSQSVSPSCLEVIPVEATTVTEHSTPHTFGGGLVDRIPDGVLLAIQNNPPKAWISGFAQMGMPLEGGGPVVNHWGWKAQDPTLMTFSAGAARHEMGLTNRFVPDENFPNGDPAQLALCDGNPVEPMGYEDFVDPVLGMEQIDLYDQFQQMLAPPPQTPKSGMTGEAIFHNVGCADCHWQTFTTSVDALNPAFSNITFRPYSDYLVHDMGSLGDGLPAGAAGPDEFRTAPLWGIHMRQGLLHDGRATGGTFEQNVYSAITAHDGESSAATLSFLALSTADQDLLIQFIGSLGQAEFDFEDDNDVDDFDWFFIQPDFTGPGANYTPDDAESISDVDQDGDCDMHDFAVLMRAYTGQQ